MRTWSLASVVLLASFPLFTRAAPVDNNPPPGWWRDATFYEIFVRSFADSQTGPLAGDGIGDLQGAIEHLDYLNDGKNGAQSLGVNALWLMPVQPSPSYHGYDVSDYFSVNPHYGDVALMKRFVAEAHRRGIRVIVDFVLNHASSEHPLFRDAISGDPARAAKARPFFRFATIPENIVGPWSQRVWHPSGDEFYYGVFGSDMPDWNFRSAAVTDHHRRAAEFWLREIGVDGFRLDAVRYFYEDGDELQDTRETEQWLHDFTGYCHSIKPGAFVIGENTSDMREVARYLRGRALDSAFEFDLAKATVESIRLRVPGLLRQTLDRLLALYEADSPWATLVDNHDQERVLSQLAGNDASARLAAQLLFTLPGVPFVYYGEELGLSGLKPDPELRTPMPWTAEVPNAGFASPLAKPWHAVAGEFRSRNVATESADSASFLNLYRRLIRLNAASPALRHGRPLAVAADDRKIYAAMRESDRDAILVLANFDRTTRPCPVLQLRRSAIPGTWKAAEVMAAATITPPELTAEGGFAAWKPLAQLAPESVYLIHWTAPGEDRPDPARR
jgi:glycosidase